MLLYYHTEKIFVYPSLYVAKCVADEQNVSIFGVPCHDGHFTRLLYVLEQAVLRSFQVGLVRFRATFDNMPQIHQTVRCAPSNLFLYIKINKINRSRSEVTVVYLSWGSKQDS